MNIRIKSFCALLLVLAAPLPLAAQTTGTISGNVIRTPAGAFTDGQPRVAAYRAAAQLANAQQAAIADIDHTTGAYVLSGLAPGTYFVRTILRANSGYADAWYPSEVVAAQGARPRGVTVTGGTTTANIDIVVSDVTGRIDGTLTLARLPFSGPVALPTVSVYTEEGVAVRDADLTPGPGATAGSPLSTDPPAGGTFTWFVRGLPAGRYYVKTSNPAVPGSSIRPGGPTGGYWVDELYDGTPCVVSDCLPSRGTPINVTAGVAGSGTSSPRSVDLSLDYGATITGSLPPASTSAVTRVDVYDSRGVPLLVTRVATTGFSTGYFANGLPAGTYFVKMRRDAGGAFPETLYKDMPCDGCDVTSGTPVTVGAGETRSGIDFVALTTPAVRGAVRSGGTGVPDVTVEVFAPNGARLGSTVTAADGTYAFSGLHPGSYYLRTVNTAGYVDLLYNNRSCPGCDPLRGTAVAVAAGADTTAIDFSLVQGIAVSGLLQAVSGGGVATWPVPGLGVSLYTAQGTLAARAVSDAGGRFAVTVPAGTYYAASDAEPGYLRRLYANTSCPGGVCNIPSGAPIAASAPVTNVDLQVPQCSGSIISPIRLANAAVSVTYRQTLAASGGIAPFRFTIASGALPPGLTLDPASGVLSGTPTAAGAFTFTVAAHDADGCAGARSYTLDVPGCLLSVAASVSSRASGEPFQLPVTTTCASWSVSSNASWLAVEKVSSPNPDAVLIVTSAYSGTTPRTGTVTVGSRVVTVYQNGTSPQPPFGVLEAPSSGAVVAGSIGVSGWALDDLAVQRVVIYRDPVAGEPAALVFLGFATFVEGARPDVEAAYPTLPNNRRAGFGYLLLTNMLPNGGNGIFNIYAYVDDIDNKRVLLGARTITAVNSSAVAPFGAIDTPDQGATIAGAGYVNFGWALTPQPKLIPFDGSTISVLIDGVRVGPLNSYNLFRSDVSGLFPGLKNSGGPVGYRVIDTTTLSEGIHTIAWVVTDDGGAASGVGSRYFTVQNSAWQPAQKLASRVVPAAFVDSEIALADSSTAVPARVDGADVGRRAASVSTLPAGATARLVPLSRGQGLELALPVGDGTCAPRFEGYLSVNGELRALPVGSSLDPAGMFYWQPGPAFGGTYPLIFIRTSCEGSRTRVPVTVTIR